MECGHTHTHTIHSNEADELCPTLLLLLLLLFLIIIIVMNKPGFREYIEKKTTDIKQEEQRKSNKSIKSALIHVWFLAQVCFGGGGEAYTHTRSLTPL